MLYSLPALEADGVGPVSKLPVCLRVVLGSLMRNCDGERVTVSHLKSLANWQPNAAREDEIPFVVARVVLQDFTGVPLLADLAAMREAAARSGKSPDAVEPLTPGGPGRRPLGPSRPLRPARRRQTQHGN